MTRLLVIGAHSADCVWRAVGAPHRARRLEGGLSYDLDGLRALIEP
jgi:hypothetical protein